MDEKMLNHTAIKGKIITTPKNIHDGCPESTPPRNMKLFQDSAPVYVPIPIYTYIGIV